MRKIFHFLFYPILKLLHQSPSLKVLSISSKIDALEKENQFDEAINLRESWFAKIKFKNSAPLWLSEGKFQLNHEKQYDKALIAFENAISAREKQPLHYGAVNPLDIYYGAAVSAIMLKQMPKGQEYFKEFMDYYKCISDSKELSKYSLLYSDGIKWLREQTENKGGHLQ